MAIIPPAREDQIMNNDEYKGNLPSQKDLEKELSEYLSRKYGERVKIVSAGFLPQAEKDETARQNLIGPRDDSGIDFSLKPEELVSYLDEYVVQQDEAKAILATKICTHFNRVRYAQQHPEQARRNAGRIKGNVLLTGPTGVGKTYLIKLIAQRLGVPFIKGDATKFSETGYVGGDVEDLVRDLVREADGDIDRAQYGIIYVDEIDKIAASPQRLGADVSRTGVQRAFLKPMEETEVELKVPHDPISQIEAIEHYRATGKREKRVVNTRNILFIMSGAFAELDEIIRKRVQQQTIGFEGRLASRKEASHFLKQVRAEDLIKYGFESEFVGRLPVIAVLEELTVEDLHQILINPNSSVVVGKKQDFLAYAIRILFEDEALMEIARKAGREQTGARGLVSIMEKVLLPFEKKLPSTDIRHLVVTTDMVHQPRQELGKLLHDPAMREYHRERYQQLLLLEHERLMEFILRIRGRYLEERDVLPTPERLRLMANHCQQKNMDPGDVCEFFIDLVKQIRQCAQNISGKCGLTVSFSDEAIDRILTKEPRSMRNIKVFCEALLEVFEYGLRLLSQKKGYSEVVIQAAGIDAPEQFINGLVERSFKLD
jgi:ATP-dependent Clp protease ATP-binding subunit ClpX